MSDIPRNPLRRGLALASLPAAFAGRQAVGLGRRVQGHSPENVRADVQAATAQQLFAVLGQLKGGAMKFGQALSIFEAALPDSVAAPYREQLTKLQDAAPPMRPAAVDEVLTRELGAAWRSRFATFDDDSAAAASVGQVHRATWADGREVAVKIQYPGAGQALMSDLTQVGRMTRLSMGWVPGLDVSPLIAELKARVAEELDYRHEAAAQDAFARAFADDPHVAVPGVVAVSDRVLVTEWLEGTPLSRIISSGTREQRDAAGRLYLEFLLTGPARAGLLHADPHPGNFRLTSDGRFGVLDFGAVNRLPAGMPPAVGTLMAAALRGDAQAVLNGLRTEGFVKSSIDVDARELLAYLLPFLEPLRHEVFRFERPWLQALFAQVADVRSRDWAVGLKVNLPPEYVLIHRVWLGGVGVLCQLDAEVRALDVLTDHLPGFTDREP